METNSFITSLLGDCIALGGRDDIPSGFMYLAGPETVKWADGKAPHPDQIDTIEFRGQPAKVIKRFASERAPTSWTRGNGVKNPDGTWGQERVTLSARIDHKVYLKTETGTVIRYEDCLGVDPDVEIVKVETIS